MKLLFTFSHRFNVIALSLFGTLGAVPSAATEQNFALAGVNGTAWLPERGGSAAPVILYSHGFHGCPTQSRFLTAALARAGYAVLAPRHSDATCGNVLKMFGRPEEPFTKPDMWGDSTYAARMQDLKTILDAAPKDMRFARFDWTHVGLVGYSLGGYTALAMAGARQSWKDHRVLAVLAVAPYTPPLVHWRMLGSVTVPVMFQAGTSDSGITPFIRMAGGAFDGTPAPKWYIELSDAGHLAWTDATRHFHPIINSYAIAFFDDRLRGKPFPRMLLDKSRDVSDIRVQLD